VPDFTALQKLEGSNVMLIPINSYTIEFTHVHPQEIDVRGSFIRTKESFLIPLSSESGANLSNSYSGLPRNTGW
jgi:hypothetical protein